MKKSLISSHSAYHRPRDKLVTYYLTAYDLDVQRQNMARDKSLVALSPMPTAIHRSLPMPKPFSSV